MRNHGVQVYEELVARVVQYMSSSLRSTRSGMLLRGLITTVRVSRRKERAWLT